MLLGHGIGREPNEDGQFAVLKERRMVVVNTAGGGAIPGRLEVVRSKPDGYTALFGRGPGYEV
jgi:hypothetical protein